MRTIIMSFKPAVYNNIRSGKKIFEHRRNFPNEPIKVYMYVSSPICAIMGILYLGKRHELIDWKNKFIDDPEAIKRIEKYEKNYRYAMEILEFQETSIINLNQLRNDVEKFVVPQMYYYIDDKEVLRYLETNLKFGEINIQHNFKNITSSQVCLN